MAMPSMQTEWTVDMLDDLPDDGKRYEIIDGVLFVTPSRNDAHQCIVGELHAMLLAYMNGGDVGRARLSPSDVRREDRRRNRVQPDVFAVRYVEGKRPEFPFDLKDLLLVVEVLSPSTATYDHHTKRKLYLDAQVPAYWIIDPEARTVSIWRPGAEIAELHADRVEWQPPRMRTPFVIELESFFREALEN